MDKELEGLFNELDAMLDGLPAERAKLTELKMKVVARLAGGPQRPEHPRQPHPREVLDGDEIGGGGR